MKKKAMLKKFGPTVAVFSLVSVGAVLALPKNNGSASGADLVPVVVVTKSIPGGSSTASLEGNVEVRNIPRSAQVKGALASVSEIPDGVLAFDHASGQQLLETSVAEDQVAAVGEGRVAVSVLVDPQRWVGPFTISGAEVDVYAVRDDGAELISSGAVILGTPSTDGLLPKEDAIVSLAVRDETLQAVLLAASEGRLWMVGS